jgi:hypothetical protein
VDVAGFVALFDTIGRSSWRWECQGHYAVDEPQVDLWRTGQPHEDTDDDRAWFGYVDGLRRRGIPFERVRMLTEPLTTYLRWMLATTHRNVDAGEDIRWITQSKARELGMPDYDFYILDDDRLVILRFDDDTVLLGADVTDDPDAVARHQEWRSLVWRHAVPHREYLAGAGSV